MHSVRLGIVCALRRRRQAIRSAVVSFLLAILAVLVPFYFVEEPLSFFRTLGQFLFFGLFLLHASVQFVLANITIPDDESAMIFMRDSVALKLGALRAQRTGI